MKKSILALTIAALTLSAVATPAFAKNHDKDDDGNRGRSLGNIFKSFDKKFDRDFPANQFMVNGTVVSVGTSSLVVNAQASMHVPNLTNGQATIVVNSSTNIRANKNETLPLSGIVAGDKVVVLGQVTGTTLTASHISVNKEAGKKKVLGKVTAKTADTLTITNALTNTSETVKVDADTQVKINGETKTVADIAVGDSGWIKLKNKAGVMVAKIVNLFR